MWCAERGFIYIPRKEEKDSFRLSSTPCPFAEERRKNIAVVVVVVDKWRSETAFRFPKNRPLSAGAGRTPITLAARPPVLLCRLHNTLL